MKIAHVTATFPPYLAGTGNVCYHSCLQLACLGHEVHAFTTRHSAAPSVEVRVGFTVHRLWPIAQVGNAPVLPELLRVLHGFDVIHLHYPFILGAEMVRLVAWRSRIPLAISFHNDLVGDGGRAWLFSLYQHLSVRTTVRGAARLCVVSLDHYDSSLLRCSLTESKPRVVELPNGVDTVLFSPNGDKLVRERYGIPARVKVLLFVAALDRAHHFKGLDRLLKALRALPEDTWLLVVGDGEMRAGYERQARQLGVVDQVCFVGAVEHEDTPTFFRSADVTVLPSSPPESFGLVLLESLACGTPVLASDIPGVRTLVSKGEDGLLVRPVDVEDLATKLEIILSFPCEQRKRMGMAGRRKVEERYTWSRIGRELEALYVELLDESVDSR
ncbi:MAG: glycosyltransferase family 4 protein [Chloroflexota bacterium]|nr:glycosyltransferase family 4 protein [Chloroflexota bacterium]